MKKRSIAFLLSLIMLLSLLTPTALAEEPDQEGQATEERTEIPALSETTVAVPREAAFGDETTVTAPEGAESYQWQFQLMEGLWVNISGDESAAIVLTYAKVCNMLDESGAASLRCLVDGAASETLTVTVTDEPAQEPDETPVPDEEPVLDEEPVAQPVLLVLDPQQSAEDTIVGVSNSAVGAQEETGDETPAEDEKDTYSIVISYLFENGEQAANPWTATVAKGSSYEQIVASPVVVGYTPDQANVEVKVENIQADKSITVYYRAADVGFTVKHYLQDVAGDNSYSLDKTEAKPGYTEKSVGAGLEGSYDGFTALLYDTTTKIAADGSTVVEIYYDRNYYLLSIDLDGGYGAEPVYARYGAPVSVNDPKKAGFDFVGWKDEAGNVSKKLPATMPAGNTRYKALWQPSGTVKVTVVIWGQNANDNEYSYMDAATINATAGETVDFSDTTYKCGKVAHTHDSTCIACGLEEHKHSAACCTLAQHTHSLNCYSGVGNADSWSGYVNDSNPYNGKVKYIDFMWGDSHDGWHIYWNGTWYYCEETTALNCGKAEHTHGNGCQYCQKTEHTHDNTCYSCGKTEHTHDASCSYTAPDSKLWTLNKDKTESGKVVAGDGSTILNVYYDRTTFTLTFKTRSGYYDWVDAMVFQNVKWGEDTTKYWNQAPEGYLWYTSAEGSTFYTNAPAMPASNLDIYGKKSSGSSTIHYYEVGTTNSIWPDLKVGSSGWSFTDEDYIKIPGFTFSSSERNRNGTVYSIYYTRNSYTLEFYSYGLLTDKTKTLKYEEALKGYFFAPSYPAGLEENAYEFAGWYTSQQCVPGTEVDWDTMTMPALDKGASLMLYAKWAPKTHMVTTWLTDKMDVPVSVNGGNVQRIPHGKTAAEPEKPTNGNYEFIGWFYQDGDEEKAFDFSMPVNRDMDLYAKWNSKVLVEYTIKYELADGTTIAAPTTGSALADTTKTFDAKGGDELDADYRVGYFPETNSHSIKMDVNGKNEFTFIYVPKPSVNYRVRYLDKATGEPVLVNGNPVPDKTGTTKSAVITEKFQQITGYAPDAYQKRLVLSANEEENVLIFWYTKDDVHAPVQIIHWTQNIVGDGYTEYQSSSDLNGVIGETYKEDPMSIPGFQYNADPAHPVDGYPAKASGTLTEEGLVLNLYYDRIMYPYEFRFLEQGTNKKLADPVTNTARYQAQVTQTAKDIPGYTLASNNSQAINIAIEDPANVANKNVRIFYYTEQEVTINYVAVGPEGATDFGSVTPTSETVKAVTGEAQGSTAAANDDFRFVGWYDSADCTGTALSTELKYVPTKPGDLWTDATYYAKFEYDVADLTITKTFFPDDTNTDIDEYQSFIFHVKGLDEQNKNIEMDVVVKLGVNNNSVTIKGLEVGNYQVTEDSGWSWRYEVKSGEANPRNVEVKGGVTNTVTFTNTREMDKWLNGCSWAENNWASGKKKTDKNPDGETN